MSRRADIIAVSVTVILIIGAAVSILLTARPEVKHKTLGEHLECVIQTGSYNESDGLIAGLNYFLLNEYAEYCGKSVRITLSDTPGILDSLTSGVYGIAVVPSDGLSPDEKEVIFLDSADSICRWAVDRSYRHDAANIREWLDEWMNDEDNAAAVNRFLCTYDPYRKRKNSSYLSPYDEIIRKYAGSIGWDWRLLAAVIYQESHFRIDLKSRRGALGLMQMMPSTAKHLDVDDLINPEESIRTGSRYLKQISRNYKDIEDQQERYKFTLAAYNAGTGRIQDCINYALHKGVDPSKWENIVGIIPDMREEGMFKGVETISYVESVLGIYNEFVRICP